MKTSGSQENFHVRLVVDYADTQFLNFAIEYLHENEKVRKTVFPCSYRTQVESLKLNKNGRKSCDTIPLMEFFSSVTYSYNSL